MELASIQEVNDGFFDLFLSKAVAKAFAGENCPFIPVPKGAGTIDLLVRYYNRGGRTGKTELPEKYPVLVIQDYTPEFDATRVKVKDWLEVAVNTTDKEVQVVTLPMPLTFNYQVSLVSTIKTDNDALMDYMFKNFGVGAVNQCLMFNKQIVPVIGGEVGVPVPYRTSVNTIDREDGRFEWAITYTLMPFVHIKPAEWEPYIEQIKMVLKTKDTDENQIVFEFLVQGA